VTRTSCPETDWTLLRLAPELASLSLLACALHTARAALRSQHPALVSTPQQHDQEMIGLAHRLDARCQHLLDEIEQYRQVVVGEIDRTPCRPDEDADF
jgi:hypothetical protein